MLRRDRYRLLVAFNLICCAALFTLGNILPWREPAVRWGMIGTAVFFLVPIGWGIFLATDPFVPAASIVINAFCWARLVDWLCERLLGNSEGEGSPVSAHEPDE